MNRLKYDTTENLVLALLGVRRPQAVRIKIVYHEVHEKHEDNILKYTSCASRASWFEIRSPFKESIRERPLFIYKKKS